MKIQLILILTIVAMVVSCNKIDDTPEPRVTIEDYIGRWNDVETSNESLILQIASNAVTYLIPNGQPNIHYTDVQVTDDGVYFTLGEAGSSNWTDYKGTLSPDDFNLLTVEVIYAVSSGNIKDVSVYPIDKYKRL